MSLKPPGGPNAPFADGTAVQNVVTHGAQTDGTDDCTQAFLAAYAALPSRGGVIYVPPGLYQLDTALTFTKTIRLIGAGASVQSGSTPSVLRFASNLTGLTLETAGQFAHVSDLMLVSQNSGAGSNKGLVIRSHGATVERVVIKAFGSHGVYVDTTGSGNANGTKLMKVRADGNFGDGFNVPTGSANSNTILFDKCEASNNGGWGYFNDGNTNTFLACEAENNTSGAFKDTSNSALFLGCYVEGDAFNNADFSGSTNGSWVAGNFGSPVFTPAPAGSFRVVRDGYYDKFLRIGNSIDAGTQKQWQFSSGSYATGSFALANQSDLVNIFNVNGAVAASTQMEMLVALRMAATGNRAFLEGIEISDPTAPAANTGRLYFRDNGAGKTQLCARFPTGAVQVIATEP